VGEETYLGCAGFRTCVANWATRIHGRHIDPATDEHTAIDTRSTVLATRACYRGPPVRMDRFGPATDAVRDQQARDLCGGRGTRRLRQARLRSAPSDSQSLDAKSPVSKRNSSKALPRNAETPHAPR
jgi:hypothetical protein